MIKAIICDVEGTTISLSFVKDTLLSQHASPKLCTLVQGFSCYTGILSSNS